MFLIIFRDGSQCGGSGTRVIIMKMKREPNVKRALMVEDYACVHYVTIGITIFLLSLHRYLYILSVSFF